MMIFDNIYTGELPAPGTAVLAMIGGWLWARRRVRSGVVVG